MEQNLITMLIWTCGFIAGLVVGATSIQNILIK